MPGGAALGDDSIMNTSNTTGTDFSQFLLAARARARNVARSGLSCLALLALATGCQMQADFEDGDEQQNTGGMVTGGGQNPGVGATGSAGCGEGQNNELLADETCACLPGFDWCLPDDASSLDCCRGGGGQSCGEGSNNELIGDGCACLPGFEWCDIEDETSLDCCTPQDDIVPCDTGSHNQVTNDGQCACLPDFEWCDMDDVTNLECCGGDDTGDAGETGDTGDTGDDDTVYVGCEGEMLVTEVNVARDTVWKANSVCVVESSIVVAPGATLTIEAGTIVKFAPAETGSAGPGIQVEGQLVVGGTSAAKVYFSDLADDALAGDTNGDGGASLPQSNAESWSGIYFAPASTGSVAHAEFRYAMGDAAIFVDRATPQLASIACRKVDTECVSVGASDMLDMQAITAVQSWRSGVSVRPGSILGDVIWSAGVTRTLLGSVQVSGSASLTIDPGAVIKVPQVDPLDEAIGLQVDGVLVALGDAGAPIIWTDERDDEFGGDTNQDGSASTPQAQPGTWAGISVGSGGLAELEFTQIYFAHGEAGLSNRGDTTMKRCIVAGNRVGLRGEAPGSLVIRNSSIVGNTQFGASALGDAGIDAVENWWGDVSGPGGEGMGAGDTVSPGVAYLPFLDAPVD